MHRKWALLALLLSVTGCSAHRFFYLPNQNLYSDPASRGISYDMLEIPSLNGKTLSAIYFKSDIAPVGTVVHLHGNFGNVSCHYMGSQFLTHYGFDVLVLDYQGYGGSEGSPTPKKTIEDAISAVRYAQNHLRDSAKGVVIFGQSLGAAIGAVATAKEPLVKAAVLESGFNSYRAIARDVLKRSFWTWPLYPIYPLFLGKTYDPERYVGKISPRPVLMIAGTNDTVVPCRLTEKLFAAANEPKKLWVVDGAGHIECRTKKGKEYEQTVADFFTTALQK